MRFHAAPRAQCLMFGVVLLVLLMADSRSVGQSRTPLSFAARIEQLSEPGGYFDTDNLISNEKSYLQVIPTLGQVGVTGGVYIGVGPDQNFSYIARIRPAIAFIVDVRRDNMLLHLLFKSLFTLAETRADYLSFLFGRAPPPRLDIWKEAEVDSLATYIDGLGRSPTTALDSRIDATLDTFGVPLSRQDRETIHDFHHRFVDAGLSLKFESKGRSPRSYYPTYRELMLETDRQGRHWSFLASEADYQVLRSMQQQDLIIPVVGDLSGPTALAAIAKLMLERGDRLSAFYASNVEFYMFGDGTYPRFVENLARFPRTSHSVLIRSVFGRFTSIETVPGYFSTSLVQPIDSLVAGFSSSGYRSYYSLITAGRKR